MVAIHLVGGEKVMLISKKRHENTLEEKRRYYNRQVANALSIIHQISNTVLKAVENYEERRWGARKTISHIHEAINRSLSITNSLFNTTKEISRGEIQLNVDEEPSDETEITHQP